MKISDFLLQLDRIETGVIFICALVILILINSYRQYRLFSKLFPEEKGVPKMRNPPPPPQVRIKEPPKVGKEFLLFPPKYKRFEFFKKHWFYKIAESYPIKERTNKSFLIETKTWGKIDYFPKANKILIRSKNQWVDNGIKWINENL